MRKYLNKMIFISIFFISFGFSDEFSDGPYGTGYFDTAGPFIVPDLNVSLQGDVNLDDIINIQDVILLVGQILGNITLNDNQFNQADTNNDNILDVLDIVSLVNSILYPQLPGWNFENQWTGSDSYIFIQYDPGISSSTALWTSNTKETLLNNSPLNVHYFFISNRSFYESDVQYIKESFDDVLANFSEDLQYHWNNHL